MVARPGQCQAISCRNSSEEGLHKTLYFALLVRMEGEMEHWDISLNAHGFGRTARGCSREVEYEAFGRLREISSISHFLYFSVWMPKGTPYKSEMLELGRRWNLFLNGPFADALRSRCGSDWFDDRFEKGVASDYGAVEP